MPQQPTIDVLRSRIAKVQAAMKEMNLRAIVLESGPAMIYLTGVRGGRSERTFAVVLTETGDPAYVLPGFEEMRARELIKVGQDVRVWQEDESPFDRVAGILKQRRGVAGAARGGEDTLCFFFWFRMASGNTPGEQARTSSMSARGRH